MNTILSRLILFSCFTGLLAPPPAAAQASYEAAATAEGPIPLRSYHTERVDGKAPEIDGHLDDACWEAVEWSGEYRQWQPYSLAKPSQESMMKVLYDDRNRPVKVS